MLTIETKYIIAQETFFKSGTNAPPHSRRGWLYFNWLVKGQKVTVNKTATFRPGKEVKVLKSLKKFSRLWIQMYKV